MKKLNNLTIKTASADEFMLHVKNIMRAADRGEPVPATQTLSFEEPSEMLHFLSETKIKLIDAIRKHPDSITNIAKAINRNRSAVYRDIHEMELFGLVTIYDEINPGHGRHKVVQASASTLKLEAYI
ncbi:HTH domain-containing protein [soil metagenome]